MFLKAMLFLSFTITSSFSAQEQVGDFAIFGFLSNGVQGVQAQVIDRYDPFTKTYAMRTIIEVDGQQHSSSETLPENEIITKELASLYVSRCEEIGGTRETIKLMKRQWPTCKIPAASAEGQNYLSLLEIENSPEAGGNIWLGEFPIFGFGMVKLPNLVMILADMNWNK